jgi:hypothetical protein
MIIVLSVMARTEVGKRGFFTKITPISDLRYVAKRLCWEPLKSSCLTPAAYPTSDIGHKSALGLPRIMFPNPLLAGQDVISLNKRGA